jgi:hypothetical protein
MNPQTREQQNKAVNTQQPYNKETTNKQLVLHQEVRI